MKDWNTMLRHHRSICLYLTTIFVVFSSISISKASPGPPGLGRKRSPPIYDDDNLGSMLKNFPWNQSNIDLTEKCDSFVLHFYLKFTLVNMSQKFVNELVGRKLIHFSQVEYTQKKIAKKIKMSKIFHQMILLHQYNHSFTILVFEFITWKIDDAGVTLMPKF